MKINLSLLFVLAATCCHAQHATAPQGLAYTENVGQWADDYQFKANPPGGNLFVQRNALVFQFYNDADMKRLHDEHLRNHTDTTAVGSHSWRVQFVGCNEVTPRGKKAESYYSNYFHGNDPAKWKTHVQSYQQVWYENLWPGIDMLLYSQAELFKYEFIVHPGADPSQIVMQYAGMDSLTLQSQMLCIHTSLGAYHDLKPTSSQLMGSELKEIPTAYRLLNDSTLAFELGSFDPGKDLIIDPILVAGTLIGAEEVSYNWGYFANGDLEDNIYSFSYHAGDNLLPAAGSYDILFDGLVEIGVSKFNWDGSNLMWKTYLGGNGVDKAISSDCRVDGTIAIFIFTNSNDYPTTENTVQPVINGYADVAISILSDSGDELLNSTYFGGLGTYDGGAAEIETYLSPIGLQSIGDIRTDIDGSIFITCTTASLLYPKTLFGIEDQSRQISVAKFSADLSSLLWLTCINSPGTENAYDLELLANGNIAVTAASDDATLYTAANGFQSQKSGDFDGAVFIISGDGSQLLYSTWLGQAGNDLCVFIDEDSQGNIWLTGKSTEPMQAVGSGYYNPGSRQYIAKFSSDLSELLQLSPIGGDLADEYILHPSAFMVDVCDRIYYCGFVGVDYTESMIPNIPITPDAINTAGGFYLAVYQVNLQGLQFGTCYSGNHNHDGQNHYGEKGIAYQEQCSCTFDPFQTIEPTPWAYDTTANSTGNCEASVFKIDFESPSVVAAFTYDTYSLCSPLPVLFSNHSDSGSYSWHFGDGGGWIGTQAMEVWHTYQQPGDYLVQLAATNAESCNYTDTLQWTIHVQGTSDMQLQWQLSSTDLCANTATAFVTNQSTGADSLAWHFNEQSIAYANDLELLMPAPSVYTIQLIGYDSLCQYTDTLVSVFNVGPPVQSVIADVVLSTPCAPTLAEVTSASVNAEQYTWLINDITVSTQPNDTVPLDNAGQYEIALISTNAGSCNVHDTAFSYIEVLAAPTVTINLEDGVLTATEGISYQWYLDGEPIFGATSQTHTPLFTGLYSVEVINENGCTALSTSLNVTVGISEIDLPLLQVFPNPTSDVLMLQCTTAITEVVATDSKGAIIAHYHFSPTHSFVIDCANWAAGSYHIQAMAHGISTAVVVVQKVE